MDDYDILGAVKVWVDHEDKVLSDLARRLINRDLFKISIRREVFTETEIAAIRQQVAKEFDLNEEEVQHYVFSEKLTNSAYTDDKENINLLMKDGSTQDVAKASDNLNISALSNPVEKYFLCYPVLKAKKLSQLKLI